MLLHDIRFALRTMFTNRAFAATGILCLGFGIGLNTTIFSIVDGVLLQPYPYDAPDRILVLGEQKLKDGDEAGLSALDMRDWKAAATSFTAIAAVAARGVTVSDGGGEPERYPAAAVSWDLFSLLGTHPARGRHFVEADDRPNAEPVAIIADRLWTTRYHSDPAILGRRILIDGGPYTVVGVMPEDFAFPDNERLWIPLQPTVAGDSRDARYLFAFGRLARGVTRARAQQDLDAIARSLAREYPSSNAGWSARIRTLHEAFLPGYAKLVLGLMMAGATLVLFIACSNAANLLLARASARRRELAVRIAIGAGRARIVRQLVVEAVVLALASVPLGLALAEAGTRFIAARIPPDTIPYYVHWRVDVRSLGWSLVIAILTALVFGLVPALQTTARALQETLKEGARGSTGSRALVRNALVVTQLSLALVALVGAMLFVRSFHNMAGRELGFDTSKLLSVRVFMGGAAYDPPNARLRRVEDIVGRIEALPGVQSAFASGLVPIAGGAGGGEIEVEGRTNGPGGRPTVSLVGVTAGFYRTLAVRLRRGRDFAEAEAWDTRPVAIINEAMARRVWPTRDPLGQRFRIGTPDGSQPWLTVIGVAPDLQLFGIDPESAQADPTAFAPYGFLQSASTGVTIRAAGDPAAIALPARAAVRASDRSLPISWVRTMEDVRRREYWEHAVYVWIFAIIGSVGVLLAAAGVYGVLAYSVSQRTQEIGVRVALGAARRHVLALVIGQGLALAMAGVGLGLVLAALGTPLTRSLLFGVSPFDPFSFAVVATFLVAVALVASYVPARRAAGVDPVVALRQD